MKEFFNNFEKNANNFVANQTKEEFFGRTILSEIVYMLASLVNFIRPKSWFFLKVTKSQNDTPKNFQSETSNKAGKPNFS